MLGSGWSFPLWRTGKEWMKIHSSSPAYCSPRLDLTSFIHIHFTPNLTRGKSWVKASVEINAESRCTTIFIVKFRFNYPLLSSLLKPVRTLYLWAAILLCNTIFNTGHSIFLCNYCLLDPIGYWFLCCCYSSFVKISWFHYYI